jgi:hypothetical protein
MQKAKGVEHKWLAPPVGLAKINVDAAMSMTSAEGAIAAVCRSDSGAFLGSSLY